MHHHATTTRKQTPSWAAGLLAIAAGLALTAALTLAASAAGASTLSTLRVGTSHSARLHETILVTPSGRTLYHLKPESAHHIICTGACAKLWPPMLVHSRSTRLLAGSGVHGQLSLVGRPDGSLQVAFDGLPLYTFARDHRRGDVNGQGFAGLWFVLAQRAPHHAPPAVSRSTTAAIWTVTTTAHPATATETSRQHRRLSRRATSARRDAASPGRILVTVQQQYIDDGLRVHAAGSDEALAAQPSDSPTATTGKTP